MKPLYKNKISYLFFKLIYITIFHMNCRYRKMKKIGLLFCISFFCVLYSCRKPKPTEYDPELDFNVFSTLSPDDSITKVSVSLIHYKDHNRMLPPVIVNIGADATVLISDKLKSYSLNYDNRSDSYIIDSSKLKIIPGETYKLSVKLSNGNNTDAQTVIPFANKSLTVKIDTVSLGSYTLKASWTDTDKLTNTIYDLRFNSAKHHDYFHTMDKYFSSAILSQQISPFYFSTSPDTVVVALSVHSKEFNTLEELYMDTHKISGTGNLSKGYGCFSGCTTYRVKIIR